MAKKQKRNSNLDVDSLIANESGITNVDVSDEIEDAMLVYAIKTIIDRAIPDVRDGLKPVQRRILYSAWEKGFLPSSKLVKNAKIVGEVMGNYHPHGDGSIYDALTAMSQPWNYRYPLINFHGNNGSLDGDGAAAMRYTEGRLNNTSLTLLEDIDKECVTFKPNYSETENEPEVLPALLPNLLINGASGIATGYTTDIPPHQLGEVIDAIIETIKNPDITIDELMKHVKGPDFAVGGYLVNNDKIKELYETGKASLTFKGKCEIEQNDESGNTQVIITEIPPSIKKPKLVEQIYNICLEKKSIPRVIDVRDESEGNSIRIVVELHKTGIPEIVITELYNQTALQKNNTYIMRCIVNQTPKVLTLKEIIEYYIEHRRDVIDKRTNHALEKTKARLHIQEGFEIILSDIDKTIDIIRNADDDKQARSQLIKHFNISEIQANQILDMRLRQLTKLNQGDINKLISDLKSEIAKYQNIISSIDEIDKIIVSELKTLKTKFNDERRTKLLDESNFEQITESIDSNEPIALVLTSKNAIKHITLSSLDDLFKNGSLKERTEIFIQGTKCTMSDSFILILNTGEYVKVEFGDLLGPMTFLPEKAQIKAVIIYDNANENKAVLSITKKGIIKKVKMDGFKARMKRVAPFLDLQDDELLSIRVSELNDDNIITIATKDGLIHRFFEKSFKETAAGGKGIAGINLGDDNEVVGFDISNQNNDEDNKVVVFTKHNDNYGMKSMSLLEFKPKGRISQGIRGVDFSKKQPGEVVGLVVTSDDFFVTDNKGNVKVCKFVSLPEHNRYNKPDMVNYDIFTTKFFLE